MQNLIKNETLSKDVLDLTSSGYVYAITCDGRTKIGMSRNVKTRVNSIITQGGFTGALCAAFSTANYRLTEIRLHEYFKAYRIGNSEWFAINHDTALIGINRFITEPEQLTDAEIEILKNNRKNNIVNYVNQLTDLAHAASNALYDINDGKQELKAVYQNGVYKMISV